MIRKLLLLLLFSPAVYCSASDMSWSYHTVGKVHAVYSSMQMGKVEMLVCLADSLLKANNYKGEDVFIDIEPALRWIPIRYGLSFGRFRYLENYQGIDRDPVVFSSGIRIYIRDFDLEIKKILNLINQATMNVDLIKANQSRSFIEKVVPFADTNMSVPPAMVSNFLSSTDPEVDRLLSKKFFFNVWGSKIGEIDYYFQNDSYHLYRYTGRKPLTSGYGFSENYGADLLTIKTISEIYCPRDSGYESEYFVFSNDSVFHFISSENVVSGPYAIQNIANVRKRVQKYKYQEYPVRKYIIFIDNYSNDDNRILFFPDSNLMISNFRELEDSFYNEFFRKPVQIVKEEPASHGILWAMTVLLILSIGINIRLLWKRGK